MEAAFWSLVGLWCVGFPAGIVLALKPSVLRSRRAASTRRFGLVMVFTSVGTLCEALPSWLGWPIEIRHELVIVALLMAAGTAVLGVLAQLDRARRTRDRSDGRTAAEYSNRADQ